MQAFLNVFTTFNRADGHTLEMHLNSGAGQSPWRAPGNAMGEPQLVQIDPAAPEMPISTPDGYARELARALGPFYTQGLPSDTKALEEGVFTDPDYLSQSDLVFAERKRQFAYELARFNQRDAGFLFFYFNYEETDEGGIQNTGPIGAGFANEENFVTVDQFNDFDEILRSVY